MKRSSKEKLVNGLLTALFLAVLGGAIVAAVKYAPADPFGDNEFLQDVSDKYRY